MNSIDYEYYVAEYKKTAIKKGIKILEKASEEREKFLNLYPVERIPSLTLNDFAFAKKGYGNRDSFCNLMYSGTEHIATTGGVYISIFGLYYVDGDKLTLNDKYKKLFGEDKEAAFSQIKKEIYQLIISIDSDDYEIIEMLNLNSNFANRILAVYYPEKVLPICTANMMAEVCEAIELERTTEKDILFDNVKLRRLKEEHDSTKNWDNELFLDFCRWVGNEKGTVIPAAQRREINIQRANKIESDIEGLPLTGEEKKALVNIRVNQDVYRRELLNKYHSCVLCKVNDEHLLVASHIKPWADSTPEERLDINNGFLLCPNHDKLFDRGYISFDNKGKILISEKLDKLNQAFMNIHEDMQIKIEDEQKEYLGYHRAFIFKKYYYGRIKNYSRVDGFGFIYDEEGNDVFISSYQLGRRDHKVHIGTLVKFQKIKKDGRIVADNVEVEDRFPNGNTFKLPDGNEIGLRHIFKYGLVTGEKAMKRLGISKSELALNSISMNDLDYLYISTSRYEYKFFKLNSPYNGGDGKCDIENYYKQYNDLYLTIPKC